MDYTSEYKTDQSPTQQERLDTNITYIVDNLDAPILVEETEVPSLHKKMSTLDNVIQVLRSRQNYETKAPKEIQLLLPFIEKIKFFKEMDLKKEDLQEVCHKLQYEFLRRDEEVFHFGMISLR